MGFAKIVTTTLRYRSSFQANRKYLEDNVLRTDTFQKSLPHLGVPDLDKTLYRYLASQEAIDQSSLFAKTKIAVENFGKFRGPELQKMLLMFDAHNPDSSYASLLWLELFLGDRRPIVLTHNPVFLFKQSSLGPEYNNTVIRAANLVHSSLRFLKSLRDNKLKPDILHSYPAISSSKAFERLVGNLPSLVATYGSYLFKSFPLDMSQYRNLFNSSRIPGEVVDRHATFMESRHIVVISKGKFYTFDVFNEQDDQIPSEQLVSNLELIRNQPEHAAERPSVGVVTAMDRDSAALARQRLTFLDGGSGGINARNLKLIDSAVMVLVLCEGVSDHLPELLSTVLAGPADSRWFDKSFSLIVNRSGSAAVNFERSLCDSATVLRFVSDIFNDSETRPSVDPCLLENTERYDCAVPFFRHGRHLSKCAADCFFLKIENEGFYSSECCRCMHSLPHLQSLSNYEDF
ncbi:unnamed protein product [Mesocestoides corti]|uniref:Choline/carnitine acyltransferase domain-containing protein n=3 Tax=Mesocestoides corti TaxID=53468 RepID=A0A0R3U8F5_MESCO|nr:unnamed protein product [Mesocestoides corti]